MRKNDLYIFVSSDLDLWLFVSQNYLIIQKCKV